VVVVGRSLVAVVDVGTGRSVVVELTLLLLVLLLCLATLTRYCVVCGGRSVVHSIICGGRWCPLHGGRSVICDNDGGSVATVVDIGAHSVVFDVGLRRACSPWLIATIAFLLDYKWISNVFFLHYFFINCIVVFITARPGLNSMPLAHDIVLYFFY